MARKGKRHSAPLGMPQRKRDRNPDMAVQVRLIGGPWSGVVMNVGAFDLRAVSLGRRIVDDQQQTFGQRESSQYQGYQLCGDRFGLASNYRQEIIVVVEIVADPRRSEPTGYRAASVGKESKRRTESAALIGQKVQRSGFRVSILTGWEVA